MSEPQHENPLDSDSSDRHKEDVVYQALEEVFGYRSFKPNQEKIIRAILEGRDVFAVMPTGGGKSLCYQLPALILDGVSVVISPLLALMKDQVDAAQRNGINAATINSTTSTAEWRSIMQDLDRGRLNLLYVSPERFANESFRETLRNTELSFFAVDEAHCISQWGHNFRAEYLELGQIVESFPSCPVAAFTASATPKVAEDVKASLKLRDPLSVVASFDRPNLFYQISYKNNFKKQLLDFLEEVKGESGIVYRSTRKKVEETAEDLLAAGYKAAAYHAGMSDKERIRIQEEFANDTTPIIVATIAFGMGIDKPNVRFVVHGDLPNDVESYYQETGRAGRDGSAARCALFYGYQDVVLRKSFLESYYDQESREAAEKRLNELVRFVEADGCRRVNLLKYFGETYRPIDLTSDDDNRKESNRCGGCDFCVGTSERVDATIDAQKALSAMQRTGNRFGASHLANILVGEMTDRVEALGHNRLPTFGVGADRSKEYWRYLIQSLVTQGLADLNPDLEFPIPQVNANGWEVMRGQREVSILKRPDAATRRKNQTITRFVNASVDPYDKTNLAPKDRRLFERLREKRAEIAKFIGKPPYTVFSDKTLVDMACIKPQNEDDFLLVHGVGRAKLNSFGDDFIDVIIDFLDQEKS